MNIFQEMSDATRVLTRERWFTAVVSATLALGIAINATVFLLFDAFLLRGLPFEEPQRILYVGQPDVVTGRLFGVSWPDFLDLRDAQKSFIEMAAWSRATMNVSDPDKTAERFAGVSISGNGFRALGARPILGRDFTDEDDEFGANSVAMLGYGIWKNRYGQDPSIVGRVIRVNDVPTTVVGVMPEAMKFPDAELWLPLASLPKLSNQRRNQRLQVQAFGRLGAWSHTPSDSERAGGDRGPPGARLPRDQ